MEIPNRSGIYLILLPKWKLGYVGRTSNLKRRYLDHLENSHKIEIKNYLKEFQSFEFLILEFTDGYKPKDQAIIEEYWITHYGSKIKLLNITKPTNELMRCLPKAVIAFKQDTLELFGEWSSATKAAKDVNGNTTGIFDAITEKQHSKHNGIKLAYKGLYWFEKDNFDIGQLYRKKKLHDEQLLNRQASLCKGSKRKKVIQRDLFGNIVHLWNSTKEASNHYGISRQYLNSIILGKKEGKRLTDCTWEYTT